MRRGVTVRTGDIFGYPTYVRVTVGTREQNERFIEALQEALAVLRAPGEAMGTS
jgi:histidinol-phosphate aminotransferase